MSPEAWTFASGVVAVLGGIIMLLVQQHKQGKQFSSSHDGDTPTVRAMLQQIVTDQANHRIAETQYHAEQERAMATQEQTLIELSNAVTDVHDEVTGLKQRGTDFSQDLYRALMEVKTRVDTLHPDAP